MSTIKEKINLDLLKYAHIFKLKIKSCAQKEIDEIEKLFQENGYEIKDLSKINIKEHTIYFNIDLEKDKILCSAENRGHGIRFNYTIKDQYEKLIYYSITSLFVNYNHYPFEAQIHIKRNDKSRVCQDDYYILHDIFEKSLDKRVNDHILKGYDLKWKKDNRNNLKQIYDKNGYYII